MDEKKQIKFSYLLMISLCLVFTFSIGVKAVYNTALVEIREEYGLTNLETQIGSFVYYGVYAVSQILLAIFIKKFNMEKLFFFSIIISSISYGSMIFADKAWKLWLLMGINGVLQAPHWSGCMYFISKLLKGDYKQKAIETMAVANPAGTALASGIVALFVFMQQWRLAFVLLGALMIFSAFLFLYSEKSLIKTAQEDIVDGGEKINSKQKVQLTKNQRIAVLGTIAAMFCLHILLAGGYTVVKNTLSLFLFDVHNVDKALSILLTLFLPVIAMIMKLILFKIYFKYKNYLLISLIVDIMALALTLILFFIYQDSIIISLILFIFVYSFVICVSTMLSSIFSIEIENKVNAGASSAFLNAGSSIGCAVMPLLGGAILDLGGILSWNLMFIYILGMIGVGVLFLLTFILTKKKNYTFSDSTETKK